MFSKSYPFKSFASIQDLEKFLEDFDESASFFVILISCGYFGPAKALLDYYKNDLNKNNLLNYKSGKPLIEACKKGNIDLINFLIKEGAVIKNAQMIL